MKNIFYQFQAFWANSGNVESINICTLTESVITNQGETVNSQSQ